MRSQRDGRWTWPSTVQQYQSLTRSKKFYINTHILIYWLSEFKIYWWHLFNGLKVDWLWILECFPECQRFSNNYRGALSSTDFLTSSLWKLWKACPMWKERGPSLASRCTYTSCHTFDKFLQGGLHCKRKRNKFDIKIKAMKQGIFALSITRIL